MSGGLSKPLGIRVGDVRLWRANLDDHQDRAELLSILCSREENRRASHLPDGPNRARFLARRGLLRILLGDCAQRNLAPMTLLSSSAHLGGLGLFALSRTSMLGLGLAPFRDRSALPPGVLTPEEALLLSGAVDEQRIVALLVAAREAAQRACPGVPLPGLVGRIARCAETGEPQPLGFRSLVIEAVELGAAMACVVHDGHVRSSALMRLGV